MAPEHPGATVDLESRALRLLEEVRYLTLATAGSDGRPWAATVWYAVLPGSPGPLPRGLVWCSHPAARHSVDLAARPEVGIAIQDTTQPANRGEGLQLAAVAEAVPDDRVDEAVAAFSRASLAAGGPAWTRTDLEQPDGPRIYLARIERLLLLGGGARVELTPG